MTQLTEVARRKRGSAFPSEVVAGWGRKIKARRLSLGLTQEAFASLLGIDQSTVSRLERGRLPIVSDETKWRVAGALAVTIDDLFPNPNTKPPFPEQVAS